MSEERKLALEEGEEAIIVRPRKINMRCPKCKEGFMKFSGPVLTSDPAQYGHICNRYTCKHKGFYYKSYPYIDYIEF